MHEAPEPEKPPAPPTLTGKPPSTKVMAQSLEVAREAISGGGDLASMDTAALEGAMKLLQESATASTPLAAEAATVESAPPPVGSGKRLMKKTPAKRASPAESTPAPVTQVNGEIELQIEPLAAPPGQPLLKRPRRIAADPGGDVANNPPPQESATPQESAMDVEEPTEDDSSSSSGSS